MVKKGTTFNTYSDGLKLSAVQSYLNGEGSYQAIAKQYNIRSSTQLKDWVKKYKELGDITDTRGKNSGTQGIPNPLKGKRVHFNSVEEERDYYKAQVAYLKKRLSKSVNGGALRHKERYRIIESLKMKYPITWLTKFAGVHRAGYYKWIRAKTAKNVRSEADQQLKKVIQSIHLKYKQYGYPRMKIALQEEGFFVNHKKVYRLMSELNIQSIIRKKRRFFKGNYSNTFPNVLNREFKNRKQNEALVTDITYLRIQDGFRYLSVVQDIYNNEIVSWKISRRNDNELVLDTLENLVQKRDVRGTILHSDQGFQYTSHVYNKRLSDLGIIGSHSRKGNCHDNACIESFFSHFKSEMLYLHHFKTEEEVVQAIEEYIYFYNYKRFQKRLNHRAPIEYRILMAA
ncbi:IS3 family transposase [Bacillus bingmayongensis]|uniref:IS3 family transposase n=1 Tax=Bacillus bingmayongensis TaxID=1150157 RepID=UPI0012B55208|nr:IS3 family transposase [Bacillus bingmayongensis]MBY0596833.1 IS3 family transposase [Bacillus bingmayongensis]MBY0596936.1 IS3 family transposase [Bacillus bingmayongensis]MBY0598488.1 IS3 family transposase [Bacillus bingmayongensis]MBY0598736.1 IS3 family transposase [Bacillus bingmayongensis]MBY0598984.1 IS3 family transposase [Bacillus bingmayongensis]